MKGYDVYSPLSVTHLRFDLVARTQIKLDYHKSGDWLRNALASVMLRTACPENPRMLKPSQEHAATCPVCWLLSAEVNPGQVRRAYSLVPPLPPVDTLQPDERFSFVLTLFGDGFNYLPYFVLAVPEMGRVGVGPGRGQFGLHAIYACNPYNGTQKTVLAPGDEIVRIPENSFGFPVQDQSVQGYEFFVDGDNLIEIQFLTPVRLIDQRKVARMPDFGILFRRLLQRIDELARQYAGNTKHDLEYVHYLNNKADQVRIVNTQIEWVDLFSWSGRQRKYIPMGGLVGRAHYRTQSWDELMPWLLFGQGTQVGKLTVKGNGVFQIRRHGIPPYWEQIYS